MASKSRQWPKCSYRFCYIRPDPSAAVMCDSLAYTSVSVSGDGTRQISERARPFCSECCRSMAKHESDIVLLPEWLYTSNLKNFYRRGMKRYEENIHQEPEQIKDWSKIVEEKVEDPEY